MKIFTALLCVLFILFSSFNAFAQTTFTWNGGTGNWSMPTNWAPNGVPTSSDNVEITAAGTYTVTLDVDATISNLTIGGTSGIQSLSLSSRTLGINGAATINDSGNVSLNNSTLSGSGSISNVGTMTLDQSNIDLDFDNAGLINFWRSCNINGTFTTQANSIIRLSSAYAYASRPTFANGFTNNGLIEAITSYANAPGRIYVTNGILTNATGGTIHPLTSTVYLYASLDNQGDLILDRNLTIDKADAAHTNSGTISINLGVLTLTQSGTSPSFTNTGTITVDSTTTITVNGGSFNYSSGTFTLYGSFSATNVTLDFTPAFDNSGTIGLTSSTLSCASTFTNQNVLNLSGSTINGNGSLTNTGTMTVHGSTFNLDFDNDGFANFNGACNINNAFTTQLNSTIRLSTAYAYGAYLTIANGFTNNGLIEYITSYYNAVGTLDVTSGILVNAAGGTIHTPSAASYNNSLFASLYNQGTLILDNPMTINKASAMHTNSGNISVNSGALTFTQTGSLPSFTTTGILTVDSTGTLAINGGSFDYSSGTFTLDGSFSATNAIIDMNSSFNRIVNNFTLDNSTLTCNSSITNQGNMSLTSSMLYGTNDLINQGNLNLTSSSIDSFATLTNTGTMAVNNGTIDVDFDNGGFATFYNACFINDALTTQQNSTIRLSSAYASGAYLTIANGFTNNGLIDYTTSYYDAAGRLDVTSGIFVNAAGGIIHTPSAASYNNFLYAPLYNQGNFLLERPMTINEASATHINTGTITVNAALYFNGASFENRLAGSLNGNGTIDVTNVTFTNEGTINPGASAGALNITGDLPQDTSSVINIELGGTVVDSSYDQLNISGTAYLDGTLNISLINNFIPVVGDTFDIMTFSSVSDTFTTINGLYTGTGVLFDLITSPTTMQLVTTSAPNHPPIVANQISNMFLDEDFGTHWVAHLDSVFDDSDISLGDSLSYQVLIEGNILSGAISNRELFLYSVNDSNGVVSVVVAATDMSSTSVSDTFDVTTVAVNDPPSVFSLLEPQDQVTLTSADTIGFVWSSSFDVDNDPLEYELNIFGSGLDTTLGSITDTSFEFLSGNYLQLSTTYQWTVSVFDGLVLVTSPDTFSFTTPAPSNIEDQLNPVPLTYSLRQNYPNPFNPNTTIEFDLPKMSKVSLKVFNILGEEIAVVFSDQLPAGSYSYNLNAQCWASGVYIYRLQAVDPSSQGAHQLFVETRKMILTR